MVSVSVLLGRESPVKSGNEMEARLPVRVSSGYALRLIHGAFLRSAGPSLRGH